MYDNATEYYWYLIEAEAMTPKEAAAFAGLADLTMDSYDYEEGGKDAFCGYDCDGYAIG